MQVDAQTYLRLCEEAHTLVFFDIEATNLKSDFGSILCVSFKPYGQPAYTLKVKQPGRDKKLVRAVKRELEKYDLWCGFYSKLFDIKAINTRLLNYHIDPVEPRPHLDIYWQLRYHLNLARGNQGHIVSWLRLPEQKMGMSADDWNMVLADPHKAMPKMVKRCVSDVTGTEQLYDRTKHLFRDIKK